MVVSEKQQNKAVIFQQNSEKKSFSQAPAWIYQGQVIGIGVKQGQGHLMTSEGDTFEGEWSNNYPNGQGIYTTKRYVYKGSFVDGKKQGMGEIQFKDVSSSQQSPSRSSKDRNSFRDFSVDVSNYKGCFKNDRIQGHGIVSYSNGNIYQGELLNGSPNGQGIYSSAQMRYEGSWVKGRMEGSGRCEWFSDPKDFGTRSGKLAVSSSYTGEYRQGMKHGFGEYITEGGKIYRGNWYEGKFLPDPQAYVSE